MSIIYSFFLVCPSEGEWHLFRTNIKIQKKCNKRKQEKTKEKKRLNQKTLPIIHTY